MKLSTPEKRWVVWHPFVAKKSMRITQHVLVITDSIKKSGTIGMDNNGGYLDAFKHTYWMASLTLEIGARKTKKLGIAHERGNYLQFKNMKLEDNYLPDSVSSVMDLKNNEQGIRIALENKSNKTLLMQQVVKNLQEGNLFVIKKNKQGDYLTCDNEVLLIIDWKGKWGIPKCIVNSNWQSN
ncbi:MAG: hypothetical protein JNL69_06680 [Bacteroidia bacterium]|nr:hypothetical protein [Bacteroidia bacterium]